jgi:hypothetical protein
MKGVHVRTLSPPTHNKFALIAGRFLTRPVLSAVLRAVEVKFRTLDLLAAAMPIAAEHFPKKDSDYEPEIVKTCMWNGSFVGCVRWNFNRFCIRSYADLESHQQSK